MGQIEGLERILSEHPFFHDMSAHARGLIAGCAANRVFHDGDRIQHEGHSADTFFLIRRGTVALEIHVPGRTPLVIETLGDGDVLGWSWLVPPFRIRFDSRAVGLVRALSIDGKCLRAKCDQDCALGYEFYKHFLPVVASRLTAARLQLLDMYGHPDAYAAEARTAVSEEPSAPARPSPDEP
jgi:CRP/FNR family cyclic AMP-dependent transcriptional regulator